MTLTNITFRVEIYNICRGGRAVGTGFLVARVLNGCRGNTVASFDRDEKAARELAAKLNAEGAAP